MSLEGVIKTDSSVEQMVYFVWELQRSRDSIKGRLFEGSIGLKEGFVVYFVRGKDCWGFLEGSPTLLI